LQESIFFSTPRNIKKQKISNASKKKIKLLPTHSANLTDIASYVNRFMDKVCGLDTADHWTERRASGNSGFKKLAVQWLNEHSTSHQHLWWLDSFVLRNRQLLKPANRYRSA